MVCTINIQKKMLESEKFASKIRECLDRYKNCDWGDLNNHDKKLNDEALSKNNDRVVAYYKIDDGDIYIITEYNRTKTTILFCDEY